MTHYASPTDPHSKIEQPAHTFEAESFAREVGRRWRFFSVDFLEGGDALIYIIVGVCFFLGSLCALGYSFWNFYNTMFGKTFDPGNTGTAVIQFVSDLLLVLIIMEVLGTVTHYLKQQATSLRPFLFI